ncbi:hypothetical protein [Alcaligenes faecalis]|uniref:hypothetical protein n=1 Tax=Alcaligenes faecalis TaxID=511 RepID=UPI0018EEE977|nr:hypothetical protein [Alcaligenes faecalis]
MTVRITRQPTASNNESLPGVLTGAAEVALATHPSCRAYYQVSRAMLTGLVSSRPFSLQSFANFDSASLLLDDLSTRPGVEEAHLAFGAGTNNGNLRSEPELVALDYSSGFVMGVVFRAPPGGGGALIGNMLNMENNGSPATNARWAGLALGFGAGADANFVSGFLSGNGTRVRHTSIGITDVRDGKWHCATLAFKHGAQTLTIRLDGGHEATISTASTGGTVRDISTVGGAQQLRVAATGLAEGPTDYHFHGDIATAFCCASGSVPSTTITAWEQAMIEKFHIARGN